MHAPIQTLEQFKEESKAGRLAGSTQLRLSCNLKDFPTEIFDLADTLEILDLSGNALSSLPDRLPELHKLKILFCSDNQFTELPRVLGQCKALSMVGFRNNNIRHVLTEALPPLLRWLILTGNQLTELPLELGDRPHLQKLMVAGNRLQTLPEALGNCKSLELIRIAANRFEALPSVLLKLPRLSWLSYSGNPFCSMDEQTALQDTPVKPIPWSSLGLHQKLGEGASGVIYHASWQANKTIPVAVKVFKGGLTSDGLPMSEMSACMRVGSHLNLIPVLGKIEGHPENANGLVMSLVDASYRNLAGPPSFASCTRDVYADDMRLSLFEVLSIATGIASVAQQVHAKGIMHGDLYAHNILLGRDGHALLGDFGAACFKPTDAAQRLALEKIEVRAFGYLLEELLERCKGEASNFATLNNLRALRDACLNTDSTQRPVFTEVVASVQTAWSFSCKMSNI
ncbi:leucine-rich repeat-containing protein kinase family protein [Zwartia vadi]|uniref:leucine-rich repeat-containing protein kinase family protein n=1 Tax=Zwartia vadi TaxID=3058168 RepID=UPI0025B39A20|nr:leucine-rich repeat-containing protein kinase family protein [Zwartia vadi]MDN3987419.1 leucine-rich repeat-containing protein kinase family protein [Zwartia vadi]